MVNTQVPPKSRKPWPFYLAVAYFGLFTVALCFAAAFCFTEAFTKGGSQNIDFVIAGSVCSLLVIAFIALLAGLFNFKKGAFITALIVLAVLSFLYVYGMFTSHGSLNAIYALLSISTFAALIADPRVRQLYKFGKTTDHNAAS